MVLMIVQDVLRFFGEHIVEGGSDEIADRGKGEKHQHGGEQYGDNPQESGKDLPVPGISLRNIVDDGLLKEVKAP